jgi:protein gp37
MFWVVLAYFGVALCCPKFHDQPKDKGEGTMSNIEWTSKTWNPIVGCSRVSAGCQNCYAINQAYRNAAMGAKLDNPGRLAYYEGLTEKRGNRVEWTGKVAFVPEALEIPLKTKKPTTWFVNSMSDLFHESVTDEQLDQIFAVIALTPQHTYQVLTKRPERMLEYCRKFVSGSHLSERGQWACEMARFACENFSGFNWREVPDDGDTEYGSLSSDHVYDLLMEATTDGIIPNVWLGVTAENQATANKRIPLLLQTPASLRFLSCEPLLEDVDLANAMPLGGPDLDWVIVGGESGPGARPCDIAWVRSIVEQCKAAGVPCFVKQLGSTPKLQVHDCHQPPANWADYGSTGKGNNPDEWPEDLRVRQMPSVEVTV